MGGTNANRARLCCARGLCGAASTLIRNGIQTMAVDQAQRGARMMNRCCRHSRFPGVQTRATPCFGFPSRCARLRSLPSGLSSLTGCASPGRIVCPDPLTGQPGESGRRHPCPPGTLAPLNLRLQAIQLSPCRACSGEPSAWMVALVSPFHAMLFSPAAFRPKVRR